MKNTITSMLLLMSFLLSSSAMAKVHHVFHSSGKVVMKSGKHVHKGESGSHLANDVQPLSDYQRSVLRTAYTIAQSDGIKKPEILSGIILQESNAGIAKNFRSSKHKRACDQTVGLGQIKVGTARAILREYPDLKQHYNVNDRNLYVALATNDKFNVAVASKYIKSLSETYKSDEALIAAYNLGEGGARHVKRPGSLSYVKSVKKHILNHQLSLLQS